MMKNEKAQELILKLPVFCRVFFAEKENQLRESTILEYTRDYLSFFVFLQENEPYFKNKALADIKIDDLDKVTAESIIRFLQNTFDCSNECVENKYQLTSTGKRRLSSLSSLFDFISNISGIYCNPVQHIQNEKSQAKEGLVMDIQAQKKFMSAVINGSGLSSRQLSIHEKYVIRDTAIFMIMIDAGITVGELVRLNLSDVDFERNYLEVSRKTNEKSRIYLNHYVAQHLYAYFKIRVLQELKEKALFLSNRQSRLTSRQVERLVKKYASASLPSSYDGLTPGDLRRTCAAELYKETKNMDFITIQFGYVNNFTEEKIDMLQEELEHIGELMAEKKHMYRIPGYE